ncbi:MAG: hypothetical protein M1825_006327 [Sarcosagium campestre]|nr:MAG: hypothetical protein M1825_006327 [Sarcosagium campestre]
MSEKAPASTVSSPPIPASRLAEIASEACANAIAGSKSYEHSRTEIWNTSIINAILRVLIAESRQPPATTPSYKFAVNSTIIQHLPGVAGGRRGMHSASGAFWNNEKDGMWNYKYDGGEDKGLDIVVSVLWIAI